MNRFGVILGALLSLTVSKANASTFIKQDDQQYAYDDADGEVFMASYLGERDGKHQIIFPGRTTDSDVLIECETACQIIRYAVYSRGRKIAEERHKLRDGSPIDRMLRDAMNGELKVYTRFAEGKASRIWIGDAGRRDVASVPERQMESADLGKWTRQAKMSLTMMAAVCDTEQKYEHLHGLGGSYFQAVSSSIARSGDCQFASPGDPAAIIAEHGDLARVEYRVEGTSIIRTGWTGKEMIEEAGHSKTWSDL